MIKKLTTLIMIISLFSAYMPVSMAYDVRIAQVDEAFSPASSEQALEEQAEEVPAAQKKEKKQFKLFNKKKKTENTEQKPKERSFKNATKYAEESYKNRKEEEKASKKAARKQPKKKKSAKKDAQEIEVNLNSENSGNNAEIQTTQQVMTGSVTANKIISVDDCVKLALENNPSIVSQMMNRDIYKNKIAQAWANYFPTINLGVSASKNDMLMTNFKFPMQKYTLWNAPSAGVNLLLFDFGKTSASAGVAKKTFEASEENLQANINEIIYNVKNAYYSLLYALQQVEVQEEAVAQYEIHLKQAEAYYNIGSKAKIDVTTAQYNLNNAKLDLIQAKNTVDMAYANLNNAMGLPEFADYEIKEKLTSRKYDIIFDDIIKTAYEQRPQLLAAKKKMEGSKILIKASKYAFLPDVTGFGSYTRGGKTPGTDYGYQIGAQVAYQNLNLLLLKQQVDEAKLTYLKDKADYEVQRQSVYLEVKQAYIQFKNAQESIPVALSSMNEAKDRYDLAAGRYKVGLGDAVELKDAQTTYLNAQLGYYNTLTQYNTSAANLERVVGAPIIPVENNL